MNISFENILKNNMPRGITQPRRSQVYVGFQCHQGCGFCYYKHKCNDKMFDISKITEQIDFEYAYGIRDFELTGGEPAEHTQLREVCEYIKNKDNSSKIAVITNGSLYAANVWDLIDEVLVSYHISKNPIAYDKNMFPKGSTWNKVKKTVDKAKASNVLVRTNTVVGTFNLNMLNDIVSDLIELQPRIVNFLPVNIFDQAADMSSYIDYNKLRPLLKAAIDALKQNISDVDIYVRYMPLCEMEGYEKHILGQVQHIYDWFDWNRELDGTHILDLVKDQNLALHKLGNYGSTSLNAALNIRSNFYDKPKQCISCKFYLICDGIEKTNNICLDKYAKPVHGKLITNPFQYFQPNYALYNQLYKHDRTCL